MGMEESSSPLKTSSSRPVDGLDKRAVAVVEAETAVL